MPVPLTSRYHGVPVYEAIGADGVTRPTIGMRLIAPFEPNAAAFQHVLAGADSLEYLAWRYYGSSEAWWRIADANPAVFPLELVTGTKLGIPAPQDVGRIERTRSF